ncbi:dipeptide epimerase [Alienimonas californiensis]|uniref:Dipeptide epimerase n=1 Tax=Alienimonas californiensis TaxID=2527989 RepID=A0A517P5S1_9PLAN|nr:dipeptide epimerase [Alienimonas californiensis]QDT14729.1 L-Ala-D/L-Glu epimerase [Alienimonas californiensis]
MTTVRLHRVELPLEHPFTIARGTKTCQRSLIVTLERDGVCGYGEATEHAYYGVTLDAMTAAVERCTPLIESYQFGDPAGLWDRLRPALEGEAFVLAAIDAAAHDLYGKLAGRRTYELLGLRWERVPPSSYTVGIDSVERMVAKLRERPGWPVYKIKLGTDRDVEIVRQLREETTAPFRVDANCGWTVEETIKNSHAFKELGVEFLEQPLPADAPAADHRRVFEGSALPVIADESCRVEADVDRCRGSFHGINVKLSKCGGLTPAVRMLRRARTLGMKTMVGCMIESSVGISAAAQTLPLLDYADLDGATLLARDAADGAVVDRGVVRLPDRPGNGVELYDPTPALSDVAVTLSAPRF